MKEKKVNEYKLAIFGAFASIIFTAIYDLIKDKPLLSTLFTFVRWIWINLFEFKLRLWQAVLILILYRLIKKLVEKSRESSDRRNTKADWLLYTEDLFDGIKWKWGWVRNPLTNKMNINNLTIVCGKCGTSMSLDSSYTYGNNAQCPRCDNRINRYKDIQKVEAIIIDNVQRGLYPKRD